MNIDEIIEQYTIESSIDTNIDRLNVTEVQEKLVNNKHKWSARLINHKIKLNKYQAGKYQPVKYRRGYCSCRSI